MNRTVTWTTTRRIIRTTEPFELPERIRTRHGYLLLRLPDMLRINKKLYISKRLMDKIRRIIAKDMAERIDAMTRDAFLFGIAPARAEGE